VREERTEITENREHGEERRERIVKGEERG